MTERKRLAVTVKTVSKGIAIARVGIAPKELNTEANNDSSDYRTRKKQMVKMKK